MPSITPGKRATEPDNWHSIAARQVSREGCSGAAKRLIQLLSDDSLETLADLRDYGCVPCAVTWWLAIVEAPSCPQMRQGAFQIERKSPGAAHF